MTTITRVNEVKDLNINSFIDAGTLKLKSGKIKVGTTDYNVSFSGGKVTVGRRITLLNIFRKNESAKILARLTKAVTRVSADLMIKNNVARAMRKSVIPRGTNQVVLYGMGEVRESMRQALLAHQTANPNDNAGMIITSIDTYNASIGIEPLTLNNLPETFAKIMDGTIDQGVKLENFTEHTTPEMRAAWKTFLKDHMDHLDFLKGLGESIRNVDKKTVAKGKEGSWLAMTKKHGADATLKSFLYKNMSPNERAQAEREGDMPKYVKCLKELVMLASRGGTGLTPAKFDEVIAKTFPSKEKWDAAYYAARNFRGILVNAFFRRTSKMGLEFLREQGVPVVFQWSNRNGKSLDNKAGKADIGDKWWKPGVEGGEDKWGTITYSEMRHVTRLNNQSGRKLKVIRMTGFEE